MNKNHKHYSKNAVKSIAFLSLIFLIGTSFSPMIPTGVSEENETNDAVSILVSSINDEITISYSINEVTSSIVELDNKEYNIYSIADESNLLSRGMPDIPRISRSIIIPNDKKMDVTITAKDYIEYSGIDILPSKGDLPRTVNPDDVPYTFSSMYEEDAWYPNNLAELSDPYIIRDVRGQVVHVHPVQYNPVQHKIRIYHSIELEIMPVGPGEINTIDNDLPEFLINKEFDQIYQNHFINYDIVTSENKYDPLPEQGNMLVVTYDDFYDEMMPFVEWKNMKGIPTEMIKFSTIGTTADDIKSYIEDYYNTNGLTFVLLVGDIGQIPSLDTTTSSHVSDPSYAYIVGDDNYQDIFVGRFSAQDTQDLTTQVTRSIDYEKYPNPSGTWYDDGVGIASSEGTGDDGEYDYEHMRIIRDDLLDFTYSIVDELYDGSQGGEDASGNPTPSDVANALNEGRSIVNYCGHGSASSWGSSDFSSSDINGLTNDNMLPYVVCVACNNGEFETYDSCFAETWMRATNGGEPTGAIGVFASTQSQSWDPPMDAQDEIVDLLISETMFSLGGLSFSGTMHMMDEYGSSCYDETDTWTFFGDPSIQIRTDNPSSMNVDHSDAIIQGSTEFEVIVSGVEGALCALSHNGELLGFAYTDSAGEAIISLNEPIDDMEQVDLVITAFNKLTYIAVLDVAAPLRNIAEFDPMQGVLINYGGDETFGISYDVIAEMSEDVIVTTIVSSSSQQSTVESLFSSNGVNTANCEYLIAPSDSYWTRDYGPWFRYNATIDEIEVIDFEYNRPRPNDDEIPNVFASEYGLNSIFMDIQHTGGNYMTDGHGISASTTLVLSENTGMTEEQVQDLFSQYLGIQTYHLYPDPLGEYIEHIDCWGKFLSTDTIMILEVPTSDSQYDELEAAAAYFASQTSSLGTPYNVVRVYAPNDQPYTNSLILNDKVLVPITGSEWDDDAIASYESAMPGYEVLGFTGSWENTDALHCRTKGIPDLDMIHIDHDELINQIPDEAGFEVKADIIAYGASNSVNSAQLYWKNSSVGAWNSIVMNNDEETYTAFIPNHPCGETIHYYISAENIVNDIFTDPFIGAADPYSFMVTLVPDVWVDPVELSFIESEGKLLSQILTIGNDDYAGEPLDFNVSVTDTGGYGWLSVDTDSGLLNPGEIQNISVDVDTTGLIEGEYTESIIITSNDPDEPTVTVPVLLTVVYGTDVGVLMINSPADEIPSGFHIVNATIKNYGSEDQTNVLVNCSIFEGGIAGPILVEDFSSDPTDWTITHTEGTAWTWDDSDERMENSWGYPNAGYLDSPVLDCTGKGGISLSFWHYWKADYNTQQQDGYVRGSIDGGATFPYLIDEFHHNDPGEEEAVKEYDIPWADNQAQVVIRYDIYNDNDYYWRIDDFNVTAGLSGDMVYNAETTVDINAFEQEYVEFMPEWNAISGNYSIMVKTLLSGDEDETNDATGTIVTIVGPELAIDPTEFNAGTVLLNDTVITTFYIWNDGFELLEYEIIESCSWVDISPTSGESTGEIDEITVTLNTTGLSLGSHHCDVEINSNAGNELFSIDVFVVDDTTPLLDVEQGLFDRGFRLMPGWDAAQEFEPSYDILPSVELYLSKFGAPTGDVTVQICEGSAGGTVLTETVLNPDDVPSFPDYAWVTIDIDDITVTPGETYVIVLKDATGSDTHNCVQWGWCDSYPSGSGGPYDGGWFYFRKEGNPTWSPIRDWDFTFRTYGLL